MSKNRKNIAGYLSRFCRTYSRSAPVYDSYAGRLLENAELNLGIFASQFGLEIVPRHGQGNRAASVPMIAFLDPDVTSTVQSGVYVCYLFDAVLLDNGETRIDNFYLSLNQGVTELSKKWGPGWVSAGILKTAANKMRGLLNRLSSVDDLDTTIFFEGAASNIPKLYEDGNIVAIHYNVNDLPQTSQLKDDLLRFFELYRIVAIGETAPEVPAETREAQLEKCLELISEIGRVAPQMGDLTDLNRALGDALSALRRGDQAN